MDQLIEPRLRATMHRKRSIQACLSCRARKVRCDVSSRGQPCTNCHLDAKNCLLVDRASRMSEAPHYSVRALRRLTFLTHRGQEAPRRRSQRQPSDRSFHQQQQQQQQPPTYPGGDADVMASHKLSQLGESEWNAEDAASVDFANFWGLEMDTALQYVNPFDGNNPTGADHDLMIPESLETANRMREIEATPQEGMPRLGDQLRTRSDSGSVYQRKRLNYGSATVLYSHYRYLTIGNLYNIPHQDLSYLEAQGCLHVPTRPILDNFVEQYFSHVHVFIPLLNEGNFWDMYSQRENATSDNKISLLLFHAMLFASCNFVPLETIQTLGFSSIRTARAEYYRRTKLLFDLETETTSLPLAQSALLLMGWVPPSNATLSPHKTWLSRAIQHARTCNADRHAEVFELPTSATPGERKHHNALRRLWWCCVILDRISPLCTRFSLHITHDRFDFKCSARLGTADLQDEIYRSSVFTPASKRRLIALFSTFLEFAIILTDVLSLTFPLEDTVKSPGESLEDEDLKITKCDASLKTWYARAAAEYPPCEGDYQNLPDKQQGGTKAMILFTNLMYIYYHTAVIALCHYKILHQSLASTQTGTEMGEVGNSTQLDASRCELENSMERVTKFFGLLSRCRLARRLPISAVACIAVPLTLHVISARLSCLNKELAFDFTISGSDSASASSQQRLDVLSETMTAFVPQYDGVEWIKETARHVANLAQTDRLSLSQPGQTSITDWSQILTSQPNTYLRMIWTVDLCISKGRLPEKHDFPSWLLGQLTLSRSTSVQQQEQPSAAAKSTAHGGSVNCDIEQILGLVPQTAEYGPSGRLVDEESNDFGNDWGHGDNAVGTGWNFLGTLQE